MKKTENGVTTYYLRSSVLGGQVAAEIKSFGGSWGWSRGFVYDGGGSLLAIQSDGVVRWIHQDPVTKSQRVSDSVGNVSSVVDVDPWGGETSRSWNAGLQSRKYTSYDRDGNGSDEAMMRRYNRWHSRFDQPDPYDGSYSLTNPQSFNRYVYTHNDPVNFTDPHGLDDIPSIGTFDFGTIIGRPVGLGGGTIRGNPDPEITTNAGTEPGDIGAVVPQDNGTACERMADAAQRIADAAILGNPMKDLPRMALSRFNQEFGLVTFGSYFTESHLGYWGTWKSGRNNVLGTRSYQGDSGFHPSFRDTIKPGEDQVHHFGAYFSAGFTGHKFAPDVHRADDREAKNWGDVKLADQSRRLGDYLRRNPNQLNKVGKLIMDTICNGGALPG